MDEISIIDKYFKPLSKNFKDSLELNDDAAILKKIPEDNIVISVDNFIYGVHCPVWLNEKYAIIRAILVAISDLSAMGAKPYCIFLSITLSKKMNKKFFYNLNKGIAKALKITKTYLAGGDICSSIGPISFSVTVVGTGKKKKLLKRKGAKPGDILFVTGNSGSAKIGLDLL